MELLIFLGFFLISVLASFAFFQGQNSNVSISAGKMLGGCVCVVAFGFVVLVLVVNVLARTTVHFELLLLFLFAMFLGWTAAVGLKSSRERNRETEQREERRKARRRKKDDNNSAGV